MYKVAHWHLAAYGKDKIHPKCSSREDQRNYVCTVEHSAAFKENERNLCIPTEHAQERYEAQTSVPGVLWLM